MVAAIVEMLTCRCAWCNRAWTECGWLPWITEHPAQETSTICPRCADKLQQRDLSR